MTGAVHVEESPLARITAGRAVFVVSAVLGVLSATACLVLTAVAPDGLHFDGPVSDVPVIPEQRIASFQRAFSGFGAATMAMTMVAVAAVRCLRGEVWRELGGWLLGAFVVLGLGGFVLIAQTLAGGDDRAEVISGALPVWWMNLIAILWLSHVVSYPSATARLGYGQGKPER